MIRIRDSVYMSEKLIKDIVHDKRRDTYYVSCTDGLKWKISKADYNRLMKERSNE